MGLLDDKGSPTARVTAVQQDVSVRLSGGREPVGAALSSASDAGVAASLPDEGTAPRRAKGVLNPSRQRGCFQRETAAKGCRIPLLLFIGSCVRAGRVRACPRGAGHILPAGSGSAWRVVAGMPGLSTGVLP